MLLFEFQVECTNCYCFLAVCDTIPNRDVLLQTTEGTLYSGLTVTFTCAANGTLNGSSTAACMESGMWYPTDIPNCIAGTLVRIELTVCT